MDRESLPAQKFSSTTDQLHRLLSLFRRSFRHFWKGVLVCVLGALIAVGMALVRKRIFISEATVLYRQSIDPSVISNEERRATANDIGARLRELIMARPQMQRLIEKYKLFPKTVAQRGYMEAVDLLRENIEFRVGKGDTFHIAFRASSPEIAQQIATDLADLLIAQDTTLRQEQAKTTLKFLEEETQRMQKRLQAKEKALAVFLDENPAFAQETTPNAAGAAVRAQRREIKGGNSARTALQRQADRLRVLLRQPGARMPKGAPDPRLVETLDAAKNELREAQANLSEKQSMYTGRHPDRIAAENRVRLAKARVTRVHAQVEASRRVTKMPQVSNVDKDKLQEELRKIERQITATKKGDRINPGGDRASRIVALETNWQRLNREVKEARERYLKLEERQFKATLAASSESAARGAQMQIIDPAFLPTRPAGTGRTVIVAAGLGVSLVLAALLMFGLALLDDRIYDSLDVERTGIANVLVEVPRPGRRPLASRRKA